MNTYVRTAIFGGVFVGARAALFFAPITLANLLPVADYGRIETAQAIGSFLSILAALGLSNTVPLILIRKDRSARWDTLLLLIVVSSAAMLAIAASGSFFVDDIGSPWLLVPLATGLLMLQGFWATVLKSRGQSSEAVILEASFWLVALAGGALFACCGRSIGWIFALLLGYGVVLLMTTVRAYLAVRTTFALSDIYDNLRLAAPLLATALLGVFVSTAGRTILSFGASDAVVGLYSVLYRATALPLVAHQIVIIWQFRQIFSWDEARIRKILPIIASIVGACIFGQWSLAKHLGWLLGDRFVDTFHRHEMAGEIILIQTILWSAIAMNDLLNTRLKRSGKVAIWTSIFLVPASFILLIIVAEVSRTDAPDHVLETFVGGYAALMLGYYLVQCFAMYRKGAWYPELWVVSTGIFVGMICLTLLLG
ncbi:MULTISPECIES: polysaccharide biosynthesis protein [Sphingobium]|uniref:Polysaccharide biosynthesis protein n=1 Tax=Sphingobium chungbukense TaxID=56193 RepID=A0A0M3AL25_9SPHN|nr:MULTISPECIES: hypothetical protein [Sphingobium]AMK26084.1 hypothetical protein K426_25925 [Sphingobium sp. TKS]KKW90550.1 hypothetical protein YP76_18320 [Sphingobium chungbukense]